MRVNKTVSTVLATTFAGAVALGGFTAATAFAADDPRQQVAQQAPLPKAQKLQQQARLLGETGGVLQPVAELLEAVQNAPEGRLSQAEADRHAKAVQEALATLQQQARQGVQQGAPNQVAPNQAPQHQAAQNAADRAPAANLMAKAADQLQKQVEALLRAAESGDQKKIAKEAEATVQATVNLLTSVVASGQLPAANMKGLPKIPNLPQSPQAQDQQQIPQLPENQLPPGDPKLELLPN